MNKLEELIKEYCPDGVEYKPFGDFTTIVRGASPRPIKNFITSDVDGINWIKIGDVKPGSKYITETAEKITPDGAKKSRFVKEGDFILSNSMSFGRPYIMKTQGCIHDGWLSISDFSNIYITDFLYHLLNSNKYQQLMKQKASFGGAVQNLNADIVKSLEMPIVPLEVQREIVKILDNFTLLTAELTAELTARRKQYEYYRDKLLSFDVHGGAGDVEWRTLREIGNWSGGKTPSMSNSSYWKNGVIPWITSKDMKSPTLSDTQDHITQFAISDASMTLYPPNSIAIVTRSGILKHTFPVAFIPFKTTINQDIKILVPNKSILPRFAFHLLQGKGNEILTKAKKQGGTVDSLDFQKILDYKVPIPSLEIQEKIVSVLDNFDAICSDLSIGLPAEIEARQKQYEYYRDALLSFDSSYFVNVEREREREREREMSGAAD